MSWMDAEDKSRGGQMDLFHKSEKGIERAVTEIEEDAEEGTTMCTSMKKRSRQTFTFADLGLSEWICTSTSNMGFKKPTEIQKVCIPAILEGRDVLACAETGSGKTAAFVLPILQQLSEDPYGIFAIILTPTRELAIQISEQVSALGASFSVRTSLIIGGVNQLEQSKALAKLPHIVIATPGRLRSHLESAEPPDLRRSLFLVLDEADRLLSTGFADELELILSRMSAKRRTLLFSATLTSSLEELETLALNSALRFDLTRTQKIPTTLAQHYLFMPAKIKTCYLIAVLKKIFDAESKAAEDNGDAGDSNLHSLHSSLTDVLDNSSSKGGHKQKNGNKKKRKGGGSKKVAEETHQLKSFSIIIFVSTCRRGEETAEILRQLNMDCVALHSLMNQTTRMASLAKFKNQLSRILIATDVASRGLDIPEVDLVINFDLPKVSADYVHRVGRTARAGRGGRALSFVTQYDVELLQSIETYMGMQLETSSEVVDGDIVSLLDPVSKAMGLATLKLEDTGFNEKVQVMRKRKRTKKRQVLRRHNSKTEGSKGSEGSEGSVQS